MEVAPAETVACVAGIISIFICTLCMVFREVDSSGLLSEIAVKMKIKPKLTTMLKRICEALAFKPANASAMRSFIEFTVGIYGL